jgi:hypothetical protein
VNGIRTIGLSIALGLWISACAIDPSEDKPLQDAESALFSGGSWTRLISEENAPISCSSGYVVDAMECTEAFCDNVALHCSPIDTSSTSVGFFEYISEESPDNESICGPNQFVVGIACSGSYCDNMSIECANFPHRISSDCVWSPYFSEEQQFQYLLTGYAAAGIRCSGHFCDSISIYECRVN